ncbi:phosphoribosylformylglycinamidine synthase, partial [Paenibacillus sepulcri]|nr:phosphoribosylformylglycinamidine synthase [Paenibacillus sepulcri]
MGELALLIEGLVKSSGISRKKDIKPLLQTFPWDRASMLDPIGDDAAVLSVPDGYLLMSCDGIMTEL